MPNFRVKHLLSSVCVLGMIMFLVPVHAAAALVFSSAPRNHLGDNDKALQSLVSYLEEVLGEQVVFDRPANWSDYTRKMRNGQYDIVFDEPHFSAWRINHIEHEPVARVPGTLGYKLIVNRGAVELNNIRDLVGVQICAPQTPELSTMTVYSMFTNPVYMPQIKEIKGDFKDVYDTLRKGECSAAVIPNEDFMRIVPSEKQDIKVIAESESMPAYTLTIGPRLISKKMLMTRKLVSAQGTRATADVMMSLGRRGQGLIPVNKLDYQGLDHLLSDVILGW